MNIGTELLVIGGGATGLSVARDAALRGFKTVLVEKGDLAHGSSGRYHGLLHSGGRYVVSDPQSARECYAENQILRRLIPAALEDTGGLFVTTPDDPPEYADTFLAACRQCGIPAEEIPVAQALRREALLNPKLLRAVRVPDAACDSFDALHLLAADAQRHGVHLLLRHRVAVLIACGVVTAASVVSISHGVLASSVIKLFFGSRVTRVCNKSDMLAVLFRTFFNNWRVLPA